MPTKPKVPDGSLQDIPEGVDIQALLESLQSRSPASIRLNRRKNAITPHSNLVPWEPLGFYLDERPVFTLDPLFHAGTYYVQEAGSMFIGHLLRSLKLDARPLKVLDLCAAPGGKSSHLLSELHPQSLLIANEFDRARAKVLKETLIKWGHSNFMLTSAGGDFFGKMESVFDLVVLDAPCSGEGMFRKDDFAREQWSPDLVKQCSNMQAGLLQNAWDALTPGGYLFYCTCTFNRAENEGLISTFLQGKSFEKIDTLNLDDRWGIFTIENEWGYSYRFFPHLTKSEGFSVTAVRKSDEKKASDRIRKGMFPKVSNKEIELLKTWEQNWQKEQIFKMDEQIYLQTAENPEWASSLISSNKCLLPGLPIADKKGKMYIPHFGLAMWNNLMEEEFPGVNLNEKQALSYLKGLSNFAVEGQKGWNLMYYQENKLGWIKHLGNRFNNYFPKPYRIRMQLS